MSGGAVTFGRFTLERRLAAPPARVFAAFADPAVKARWFAGPAGEWRQRERWCDFREGGRERLVGDWNSGLVTEFDAVYLDIVPDIRIVYGYGMRLDGRRISMSLATLEFRAESGGTRFVLTEQGAFLDGYEDGGRREHGTQALIAAMAGVVEER